MKINVALAGGPCTGKSTLAAALFAELKIRGFDYDLVTEECRKLKKEFHFRDPFDRFFMWRKQEREELRSSAMDGFVTDKPLFHFYVQVRQFARTQRDVLAVRELLRMCLEIEDRYQLIVMAKNGLEIPYKNDQSRKSDEATARTRHKMIKSFVEHFLPSKLFLVSGSLTERVQQIMEKLLEMRSRPEWDYCI